MVPPGGGIGAAENAITEPGRLQAAIKEAQEWVKQAIALVRTASEPNSWKNADDEAIAGEILKGIDARREAAKGTK